MNRPPPTNQERCRATRQDGQPCTAPRRPGSLYCIGHDPELAERRAAGRRQGGHNRSALARAMKTVPAALTPACAMLWQAMNDVYAGKLDAKRATALAALARALTTAVQAGELEDRLRRLEQDRAAAEAS